MKPIQRILIVGGGSSGWMAAALLNRRLPGVDVALIEASDIPIIGVGESTNPVMRYFHRMVGVDEPSFLRASNGAFKIAIKFEHFNRLAGCFFHPFGQPPRLDACLFQADAQAAHASYHLAKQETLFSRDCSYSYQVDAGLYGEYKKLCRERGVRHIIDRVLAAEQGPAGEIAAIRTAQSGLLQADLYIDCSGFRSFLLGGTMREPFRSVQPYLLNDRAVAARVPYLDRPSELRTYTNCVALSSGWVWLIPLWSRLGTGYVYSSAFLTESQAEAEFRQFLGEHRFKGVECNHITIRTGRHDRAWVRNCVGIGVSYGFLEPLESTGLSLTQAAIIDLARAIGQGGGEQVREAFNQRQNEMFDTTKDFVTAHFLLTQRDDTPYWQQIRYDTALPDSLRAILEQASAGSYALIDGLTNTFYEKLNWNLILSGMGFFGPPPEKTMTVALPAASLHEATLREAVYDSDDIESPVAATESPAHPIWAPTW